MITKQNIYIGAEFEFFYARKLYDSVKELKKKYNLISDSDSSIIHPSYTDSLELLFSEPILFERGLNRSMKIMDEMQEIGVETNKSCGLHFSISDPFSMAGNLIPSIHNTLLKEMDFTSMAAKWRRSRNSFCMTPRYFFEQNRATPNSKYSLNKISDYMTAVRGKYTCIAIRANSSDKLLKLSAVVRSNHPKFEKIRKNYITQPEYRLEIRFMGGKNYHTRKNLAREQINLIVDNYIKISNKELKLLK